MPCLSLLPIEGFFVLMPAAFEGLHADCNYMMYTTEVIQRKLTILSLQTYYGMCCVCVYVYVWARACVHVCVYVRVLVCVCSYYTYILLGGHTLSENLHGFAMSCDAM